MKFSGTAACEYLEDRKTQEEFLTLHTEQHERNVPGVGKMTDSERHDYFLGSRAVLYNIIESKIYLFRKTALEIINKINVKEEKMYDYLDKVSDGFKVFVPSSEYFYRFFKKNGQIVVVRIGRDAIEKGQRYWHYCMFYFDIEARANSTEFNSDVQTEIAKEEFLKMLIYFEFAEKETIYVTPGCSNGTRKTEKILNDSKISVTVVDSHWNKIVIRDEEFDVDGHLALRAYGVGRLHRRLVWINPYKKNGYTRGLSKEGKQELKVKTDGSITSTTDL
jgi:hypothetical protein